MPRHHRIQILLAKWLEQGKERKPRNQRNLKKLRSLRKRNLKEEDLKEDKYLLFSRMDQYIVRKIKSKRNEKQSGNTKYTYEYLDQHGKHIDSALAKSVMQGLYISPAYKDVKINLNQREKVLAIGYDEKDRPQYIYNPKFQEKQAKQKFQKMIDFGESYKKIMNQVKRDLHTEGDNKHKQVAMALMLVVECGIRIGSEKYKKENKSFGATTLEPRHFTIKKDVVSVNFKGKKGVQNTGKIRSKRLSRNLRIKKRTFRSNEPIFAYRRVDNWYTLKAADVNRYLKRFGNFTSKNFRTWVANLQFITQVVSFESHDKKDKNVKVAIEKVADKLNNTPAVCKKNYIDPFIMNSYLNDTTHFLRTFRQANTKDEYSEKYLELLRSQ